MRIKRLIGLSLLMGVLLQIVWHSDLALAHTLRVDRSIGVTVHINPDDEPVAQDISQIMIGVQDKEGRFARLASECICAVTVVKDGSPLETLPFVVSGESAMVSYTFPDAGIYKLEVSGVPRTLDGFQSFTTVFSYRVTGDTPDGIVSREEESTNPLRTYMPFVVIGAASFLAVLYTLPVTQKTKRRKK